jgi:uncharacterized membrane protein
MKKTLSFAVVHFSIAFSLGYLVTGSIWVGGALAVLEPTLNTVAYHIHERVWQRRMADSERSTGGVAFSAPT